VFSADATSTACTVDGDGTVHFVDVGLCVVDADQAGTADYAAATQVQQTFPVGKGAQAITFTSALPENPVVGGTYVVTATGGASGNPVRFSATAASDGVCAVSVTGSVKFTATGNCAVVAAQHGSTRYFSAPKTRLAIHVRLPQRITFTSTPAWPSSVGDHYSPVATGGASGQPVAFSIAPESAAVCRLLRGPTVSYVSTGVCGILARQSSTTQYGAATMRQDVTVYTRGTRSPIKHVVLIFQENHSFDETLGNYCSTRATPCDGYVGPVRLKNGTVVQMTHSPDIVPPVDHTPDGQTTAVDGGAMDGWTALHGCTAPRYACLSYYTPNDIPNLTTLADQFVVSDRTFSLGNSPSWGGHLYAAAATLDGFTGANPQPAPGLPVGPGWGCDSNGLTEWAAPDGTTSQVPSCVPAADGSGPFQPSPASHVSTIFDEMDAKHLPWKIYGATVPTSPTGGGGYGWSICPTFADCLYTSQVNNLVPSKNILDDAATGALPAYSVVTPSSSSRAVIGTDASQHNQASMIAGDNWIGKVVSAVENGPDWNSTAVFITYDDCGCFYDHVAPPTNPDGTAQGIRLPMVIVSPYARPGYTDSQPATLASVLAFTERNFGMPALSANDAVAYDYGQSFRLASTAGAGAPLRQSTIPKASIAWASAHPDDDDAT
jgi:phospholipase C